MTPRPIAIRSPARQAEPTLRELDALAEACGEGHEGGFEVDFFFAEELYFVAGGDEQCGEVGVVFDAGFESDGELVIRNRDGIDEVRLLEEAGGGVELRG